MLLVGLGFFFSLLIPAWREAVELFGVDVERSYMYLICYSFSCSLTTLIAISWALSGGLSGLVVRGDVDVLQGIFWFFTVLVYGTGLLLLRIARRTYAISQ